MLVLVYLFNHFTLPSWLGPCNKRSPAVTRITCLSSYSFLGVVAVSVDRFLAVHLHLRYQELVTHKRVIAVVTSIWLLSAFGTLMLLLWVPSHIHSIFLIIYGFLFVLVTTTAYIRIYFAVRRHKNQIQCLQVQQVEQTGEMANIISVVKSAVGIFYVYLVFLACYLPYFVCLAVIDVTVSCNSLKRFYFFSYTFVFLNSSLNPVIYCWKMRHIQHAIMDILRNMSWNRNRASS